MRSPRLFYRGVYDAGFSISFSECVILWFQRITYIMQRTFSNAASPCETGVCGKKKGPPFFCAIPDLFFLQIFFDTTLDNQTSRDTMCVWNNESKTKGYSWITSIGQTIQIPRSQRNSAEMALRFATLPRVVTKAIMLPSLFNG